MLDFDYLVPTKIFFGRNKLEKIFDEISCFSGGVLLVYGEGSIKRSGLYEKVIKLLVDSGITYYELPEVKPNPRIDSVRRGVAICRKNNLEFILAVGGGSTIDCSKAIAAGACYDGDPWDFFSKKSEVEQALPLGVILTFTGTGSEMNGFAVVSNEATEEKLAMGSDLLRPKFSLLDPTYTFSLSGEQTAAGVVDIFTHVMEQYFAPTKGAFLQDKLAEAIFLTCIKYGPIALKEPSNYEAKANLMWASSLALNGLIGYGKAGDWSTHMIEHVLSAMYDLTHGVGLAIIVPYWMKHVLDEERLNKFVDYARGVWSIDGLDNYKLAMAAIEKTQYFFKNMGMPATLREVGVEDKKLEEMAKKSVIFGNIGTFKQLNRNDILEILKAAF